MRMQVQHLGETLDFGRIPDGDAGVRASVAAMMAAALDAAKDPDIAHAARLFAAEAKSYRGPSQLLDRLYTWLRDFRVYAEDPPGVELVRDPLETLRAMRAGERPGIDCDDLAVLAAALLLADGRYEPVFVVVGREPKAAGGRFHHIFYGVLRNARGPATRENVIPFDPQENIPPGEWSPRVERVGVVKLRQV